ncbi:hypothetical protein [Methylomonas albis]|uniref:Uncharacterized protein n=1 Tax=Methylomonas albis TaxID=1854563 RepID=A0ABR9D581_9GAMM|nr:hypothetical protein [Methylomonas albis]MBD9358287.1 hypothetical protein [Methylomonas albis]
MLVLRSPEALKAPSAMTVDANNKRQDIAKRYPGVNLIRVEADGIPQEKPRRLSPPYT